MTATEEELLTELRKRYKAVKTLRALREMMKEKTAFPFSVGTWSRIISGKKRPSYEALCQIARMCDLLPPDPPPLVEATCVDEWHKVGEGTAKIGILFSGGGTVSFSPSEGSDTLSVTLVRPCTNRKKSKPRASVHMSSERRERLSQLKDALGMSWEDAAELLETALKFRLEESTKENRDD